MGLSRDRGEFALSVEAICSDRVMRRSALIPDPVIPSVSAKRPPRLRRRRRRTSPRARSSVLTRLITVAGCPIESARSARFGSSSVTRSRTRRSMGVRRSRCSDSSRRSRSTDLSGCTRPSSAAWNLRWGSSTGVETPSTRGAGDAARCSVALLSRSAVTTRSPSFDRRTRVVRFCTGNGGARSVLMPPVSERAGSRGMGTGLHRGARRRAADRRGSRCASIVSWSARRPGQRSRVAQVCRRLARRPWERLVPSSPTAAWPSIRVWRRKYMPGPMARGAGVVDDGSR